MRGIIYATEAEAIALQQSLLSRIDHDQRWVPFVPYQLEDGRWADEIVDTILPFLTDAEKAQIVDLPAPTAP